jgi:hypothetical protein
MNNKKYIFEVLRIGFLWTVIPNLFLFLFWIFDNSFPFASMFSLGFNSLILPIVLLIVLKKINEKYQKNWWYINYIFLSLCVVLSIYLNLFNWILSVEKGNSIYGRHNIDQGTWMIINLELTISLGILCINLIYDIINLIPEKHLKVGK